MSESSAPVAQRTEQRPSKAPAESSNLSGRSRGYAAIGLHMPKTPVNVGSALRAAHCYGAGMVVKTGQRYHRAPTDTMKAYRHLPLLQVDDLFDALPFDCVPVAVDLIDGARDLVSYTHPERAFYIFGPEDGTLGGTITKRCRDKVFVPTAFCMNLAACVNVVLYDRFAKGWR
jgi:tRNA(Leu) C34 or U34 (ribose-2'-O)-methylase TrmL